MIPELQFRTFHRLKKVVLVAALSTGLFAGGVYSATSAAAADVASFNGVYVGDLAYGTPLQARAKCTTKYSNVRITVSNGAVSMNWDGALSGTVAPDGTVLMQATNGVKVSGTIAGNVFNGTGNGVYCSFKMTFTRS